MTTIGARPDVQVGGPGAGERVETEALFHEARRRRRRRRVAGSTLLLLTLAGVARLVSRASTHTHRAPAPSVARRRVRPATPPVAARTVVTPRHPYGMTVAPNGTLYFVDTGRNQVLERLANGTFRVVAGNRKWGRSGDGGPATKAELKLEISSGIVAAKNGTLYIADTGNREVRAVLPNGTIETVAGNGKDGFFVGTARALDTAIGNPAGLAIAPNGDLYIASGTVLRLTPDGTLHWVAGTLAKSPGSFAACGSIDCNPAGEYDFTGPYMLAFDAAGDLFVSDGNGFGLYEIAAGGALSYLGQFRGDGGPGALATTPDGTVVEASHDGLTGLVNREPPANAPIGRDAASRYLVDGTRLDAALGRNRKFENVFIGGDGVAVGPNGDMYADTNDDNTFTSVNALVRVSAAGDVTALWTSKLP